MATSPISDALERARALELPGRDAMLRRDRSVQAFWMANRQLLLDAWLEWGASDPQGSVVLDDSLLDTDLRVAVAAAWDDPTRESLVADLMHEAAPGVYAFQFFDPERIVDLRDHLEAGRRGSRSGRRTASSSTVVEVAQRNPIVTGDSGTVDVIDIIEMG